MEMCVKLQSKSDKGELAYNAVEAKPIREGQFEVVKDGFEGVVYLMRPSQAESLVLGITHLAHKRTAEDGSEVWIVP